MRDESGEEVAMSVDVDATQSLEYRYKTLQSPVGKLRLVGNDHGLAAVLWERDHPGRVRVRATNEDRHYPILVETERQLEEYFAGKRRRFDVPLNFSGTSFQKSVWHELLEIPFGETRTYGEIATRLGDPSKMRAVGAANGRNPISIIAPCHRVIGASRQADRIRRWPRCQGVPARPRGRKNEVYLRP